VDTSLLAFVGISVLMIVALGPDTAVTIRNTLSGGRAGDRPDRVLARPSSFRRTPEGATGGSLAGLGAKLAPDKT
jgi:threonine/homoserine/homoserine lactone efflux protein